MRKVYNQQMYPQNPDERKDEEEDYLGSQTDIEPLVDVIWVELQTQMGIGNDASLTEDLGI